MCFATCLDLELHATRKHFVWLTFHAIADMNMQQLMVKGRKQIDEIDKTLDRAHRLVEDTREIGVNVSQLFGY